MTAPIKCRNAFLFNDANSTENTLILHFQLLMTKLKSLRSSYCVDLTLEERCQPSLFYQRQTAGNFRRLQPSPFQHQLLITPQHIWTPVCETISKCLLCFFNQYSTKCKSFNPIQTQVWQKERDLILQVARCVSSKHIFRTYSRICQLTPECQVKWRMWEVGVTDDRMCASCRVDPWAYGKVFIAWPHTICGGLFHHPALTFTRIIPEQSALFKILLQSEEMETFPLAKILLRWNG